MARLGTKMLQFWGFSVPFVLGDTLKKLVQQRFNLGLSHVVGKVSGMSVFTTSEKVWREKKEKKETSANYNGDLAVATLDHKEAEKIFCE